MSDVEKVAEIIYGAMMWASQRPAPGRTPPQWMTGGNSDAQECARQAARAALSALGGWNEAIEAANNAVSTLKERAEHHHHNDAIYLALTAINNLRRPIALDALGGWNEAIEQIDEEQRTYYRDSGSEDYHKGYIMALAAMRRRFTALRRPATPSRGEG